MASTAFEFDEDVDNDDDLVAAAAGFPASTSLLVNALKSPIDPLLPADDDSSNWKKRCVADENVSRASSDRVRRVSMTMNFRSERLMTTGVGVVGDAVGSLDGGSRSVSDGTKEGCETTATVGLGDDEAEAGL